MNPGSRWHRYAAKGVCVTSLSDVGSLGEYQVPWIRLSTHAFLNQHEPTEPELDRPDSLLPMPFLRLGKLRVTYRHPSPLL